MRPLSLTSPRSAGRGDRNRSLLPLPQTTQAGEGDAKRARESPTTVRPRPAKRGEGLSLLLAVLGDDRRPDPATHVERAFDARATRADGCDQVVEDPVGHRFVERAVVTVRPEVQLPGLELDAQGVGDVFDADGGEVGLPGLGADAGELGAVEPDDVIALRLRIHERLQ